MNIILIGLPGAGKRTQAEKIKETYNIAHISTGDMFRVAIENKTELGVQAEQYMEKGELVPYEVTIGIVKERLSEDDCDKGFLLDGFPRTIPQAEALDDILTNMNKTIDHALYVRVPEEILVDRLTGRRVCKQCGATYHVIFNPPKEDGVCDNDGAKLMQREDDQESTVKNRLAVNIKQTKLLLDYYDKQNSLMTVDGDQAIDQVFSDIQKQLAD